MEELPHLGRPISVIGRYALYGKLAAGGMATVHFGRLLGPAGFSRTVAIKRLHPQFAKDPDFVAMFLDEARLAARIQHPNVVATVDVVAMAEELFLVMDYIRGESFSRLLRTSRKKGIEIPLGIIVNVVAGMLHGLHAAHEAKDEQGRPLSVVHRDVSPQNVLVGTDGVPRVLDFGVAKAAARIQVTRDGQMKGKLSYMAPEQLQGRGVDRRTDVFAAAIVAWEALTGRRLFDAEEPQEVLRMIVSEDIPPPSAVVPSIPRVIDAIIMRGLARDLSVRYQTAREFAIALEEAVHVASAREVGEWVERVAGETLLRREQAVAEIEAVSAVSDVSSVSGPAPRGTRTMVGLAPPAPAPIAAAGDWDDGPTRIYDSAAAVSLGDDKATRVQVPHRSSPPAQPKAHLIPSLVPPAARAPRRPGQEPPTHPPPPRQPTAVRRSDPAPKTSQPPPRGAGQVPRQSSEAVSQSQPPARARAATPARQEATPARQEATPTRTQPPARRSGPPPLEGRTSVKAGPAPAAAQRTAPPLVAFDDSDKTQVMVPSSGEDVAPQALDKSQPTWDDEGETTQVIDKSGADELLDAAARVTSPPQMGLRAGAPRPAAGAPPAVTTVIVQDHTSPALRMTRPSPWTLGVVWLWGSPTARARRVGLVAGVAGLLVGVALYAARLKRPVPHTVPQPTTVEPAPPRPVAVAPVVPPEPRGIDPSMLPAAPPDEFERRPATAPERLPEPRGEVVPARVVSLAPPRSPATEAKPALPPPTPEVPPPASPAPSPPAATGETAPSAPTPAHQGGADDLESPYAHAAPPSAPKAASPAAKAPAAPKASLAAAAPKAEPPKKPKAPAGCEQPFTVDEHGIRRIKPECI